MFGRKAKKQEEELIIRRCYKAGMGNGWASGKFAIQDGDFITEEDRLNLKSICFIDRKDELRKFFKTGNWCLGQGVIYKNLFFLQQVNGGDEWATYRINDKDILQFESISFERIIRDNEFKDYMNRLIKATDEQLKNLEY